ncbi:MAG: DUF438 domain-containing protein [Anaerolineaceae bacterium]|nr:DUF438 domain-containing protein [Anaerolineaceae bacterium]
MSEHINNVTRRKEILKSILRQLHEGKSVDEVKAEFAVLANEISSEEIAEVEQMLINEGLPAEEIQNLCDVHVTVMREALDKTESPDMTPGHPVHTFRAENDAADKALGQLQKSWMAFKDKPGQAALQQVQKDLDELLGYEKHYLRKENLLFPYLERYNFPGPTQVMWQTHDQIRAQWKSLLKLLAGYATGNDGQFFTQVEAILNPLVNAIRDMFYKEDKILYPTSLKLFKETDWMAIQSQEDEFGLYNVTPGKKWMPKTIAELKIAEPSPVPAPKPSTGGALALSTGALTPEQINLMLTHLPVDLTFVDENDEVRFFSQTKERIFDRVPAIIGRKVQNCHPPQSVHRIQQILDDFRSGARDTADFWIQMMGKFILIRYLAVRDEKGDYRGTIEVTQDIADMRALAGERRLLDGEVPGK